MSNVRSQAAWALAAGLAVSLAGCASSHGRPSSTAPASSRVVNAKQIRASGVRNAWEAVRYHFRFLDLRETRGRQPTGIVSRGQSSLLLKDEPIVVLDGARMSDIGVLADVPADHIEQMRFLSSSEGTAQYGPTAGGGVILIQTKRGPDS